MVLRIWIQTAKFQSSLFEIKNDFLKKNLADTYPFKGPLIPLFWTSDDVSSGFQSQRWLTLFAFCRGVPDVC